MARPRRLYSSLTSVCGLKRLPSSSSAFVYITWPISLLFSSNAVTRPSVSSGLLPTTNLTLVPFLSVTGWKLPASIALRAGAITSSWYSGAALITFASWVIGVTFAITASSSRTSVDTGATSAGGVSSTTSCALGFSVSCAVSSANGSTIACCCCAAGLGAKISGGSGPSNWVSSTGPACIAARSASVSFCTFSRATRSLRTAGGSRAWSLLSSAAFHPS